MTGPSITDWIGALSSFGATAVAVVAAWIGLRTFRNQKTVSDVQVALQIFGEINRYWDRIISGDGSYDYNMGQILAQFEIGAGLFNRNALTKDASVILGDHIIEVFTQIQSSPEGKGLLARCCSSNTTFVELFKFIRRRMPQALNVLDFNNPRL